MSLATDGGQANGDSGVTAISPDGRFVVLGSAATNLVAGDTNGKEDVYLRDRQAGTTERVSVGASQANGDSVHGKVSADGRVVAFASNSTNLAPGPTGPVFRVYVRDRAAATTELIGAGWAPSMSADGRYVVSSSLASNLVSPDENGKFDVFVRDLVAGTTELVSVARTPEPVSVVRSPGVVGGVAGHPTRPAAGKTFAVTVPVTGASGAVGVRCAARVPGRALRARAATFRSGTARCAWRVPSRSHGAWLRGSIAVTGIGVKAVRGFAFRVH